MHMVVLTMGAILLVVGLDGRIVQGTVMVVWQGSFSDEFKYFLEDVKQVLFFVIVETQMHVSKVSYDIILLID